MPKYILLNGPAGVGKDTLGEMLAEKLRKDGRDVYVDKFAAPLKDTVAQFFNLSPSDRKFYFETPEKEKAQARFCMATPRQALINFSENWAKPTFGQSIFAKLCLERNADFDGIVIITDCGFTVEYTTVRDALPNGSTFLVRLERAGMTFDGDSREFINEPRGCVDTGLDISESMKMLTMQAESWLEAHREQA